MTALPSGLLLRAGAALLAVFVAAFPGVSAAHTAPGFHLTAACPNSLMIDFW